MSKPAVNEIAIGRYELRNFEYPDRPGQTLQFMTKVDGAVTVDGTSVDDLVKVLKHRIKVMQEEQPCNENEMILSYLGDVQAWLSNRRNRLERERQEKAEEAAEEAKEVARVVAGRDVLSIARNAALQDVFAGLGLELVGVATCRDRVPFPGL